MNKSNGFVVSAVTGALVALAFLRSCGIPLKLTDTVTAVFASLRHRNALVWSAYEAAPRKVPLESSDPPRWWGVRCEGDGD